MLPAEDLGCEVDRVIEQGELLGCDTGQVARHVHPAVQGVVVHLQEIAGIHISSTLPPVVVCLQRRVGNAVEAEEEKYRNQEFYVGEFLQLFSSKLKQFIHNRRTKSRRGKKSYDYFLVLLFNSR